MINQLIDHPGTPDAPEPPRPTLPAHLRDLDRTIRERNADYLRSEEYAAAQLAQDAPEALPSPWQMGLIDLKAHDLRYTARLMNRDDLSREERQHWGEVVENIERHHDARRWMYQRPICDVTCWHCDQSFETRDPAQGLCPPCERLADEDTRVIRFSSPSPGRSSDLA